MQPGASPKEQLARTRQIVQRFVENHGLLEGIDEVIVGLSGGSDSVALLLLMQQMSLPVSAVHLHHGLRGREADADSAWCVAFCRERGIPINTERLDVPAHKRNRESMEMAARRLRMGYWTRVLANRSGAALALGHHIDDAIENVLIRCIRGSNISGLTGLRAAATVAGIRIIRPLLSLQRNDVLAFLAAAEIDDFCRDRSNRDLRILRNRLRHDVVPRLLSGPSARRGMTKTLRYIERDARLLERLAEAHARTYRNEPLTVNALANIDRALWPRFFRYWLADQTGYDVIMGGGALRNLYLSIIARGCCNGVIAINSRCELRIQRGTISIADPQRHDTPASVSWNWPMQPTLKLFDGDVVLTARRAKRPRTVHPSSAYCEYWDASALPETLIIRARQHGDRMRPWGARRDVRVKKLLSNARLDAETRRRLPLICNVEGDILWIPGVRRADFGGVSENTAGVIELSCKRVR